MILVSETDHRFYIKESTIPNAGLGCFAKEEIKEGDYLEIIGVAVSYASLEDKCSNYADSYKFAAEPVNKFKNVIIPMGYAALVNHADFPEKQNVFISYIHNGNPRNKDAGNAVYIAMRDIKPNEELIGNYNKKSGKLVLEGVYDWPEKEKWNEFLKLNLYNLGELL